MEHSEYVNEKKQLRRSLLKIRQALPHEEWQDKSQRLCDRLETMSLFAQAHTILAYFSTRQEPDLSPLFHLNKIWGLPRCVGRELSWHVWSLGTALTTGAYGIPEPAADAPSLLIEQVDLILVPAVACDRQGYRLGYGGGYYDRLLSLPEWSQKAAIGIVFEFAQLPELPIDPWDRPLSWVCTEAGDFSCQRAS
jgi:5-formyltetrahydrofolate cyclo-ligase